VAFDAAEAAWRAELATRTIADLLAGVLHGLHPEVAAKTVTWIQEVRS
jgi:hypothetical protein